MAEESKKLVLVAEHGDGNDVSAGEIHGVTVLLEEASASSSSSSEQEVKQLENIFTLQIPPIRQDSSDIGSSVTATATTTVANTPSLEECSMTLKRKISLHEQSTCLRTTAARSFDSAPVLGRKGSSLRRSSVSSSPGTLQKFSSHPPSSDDFLGNLMHKLAVLKSQLDMGKQDQHGKQEVLPVPRQDAINRDKASGYKSKKSSEDEREEETGAVGFGPSVPLVGLTANIGLCRDRKLSFQQQRDDNGNNGEKNKCTDFGERRKSF